MPTIGQRIKLKREELKLTKAELANKIKMDEETIIKFENDEVSPDAKSLIKLSKELDTSSDYFLTGIDLKEATMSKQELCAKKDDVSLISTVSFTAFRDFWHYINKYDSVKVFDYLVKNNLLSRIIDVNRNTDEDSIEECLYFILISNNIGNFKIVNSFLESKFIGKPINTLFKDPRVTDETRCLLFDSYLVAPSNTNRPQYQIMYPFFLDYAVKYKLTKYINYFYDKIYELNMKVVKDRENDRRLSIPYTYNPNNCENQYGICYAVTAIKEETLRALLKQGKFELLIKFNELNRTINASILSEKEIELGRIEFDSKKTEEDYLKAKYTNYALLDYKGLLNFAKDEKHEDELSFAREQLDKYKKIFENILKTSYVHYLEFVEDKLNHDDYKSLFEFAVNYDIPILKEAIMSFDKKKIMDLSNNIFVIKEDKSGYYQKCMQTVRNEYKYTKDEKQINIQKIMIVKEATKKYGLEDSLIYHNIMLNQMNNFDIFYVFGDKDPIEACRKTKEDALNDFVSYYEEKVESVTNEKKKKREYESINSELTSEYLKSLCENGNEDMAIIKLCVKLETILRYVYHLDGELYNMVGDYIKTNLATQNCTDDEDNFYYICQENNRRFKRWSDLLYRLRTRRNNIVHSGEINVEFTKSDLIETIDIVEQMKGAKQ